MRARRIDDDPCDPIFLPNRQVQPTSGGEKQYRGVWTSLVRIWREEGFAGYMRGNGINCLRIVPYSAVQFTTYEQLKKVRLTRSRSLGLTTKLTPSSPQVFTNNGKRALDTPTRLMAGALAGITSVCASDPSIPVASSQLRRFAGDHPRLTNFLFSRRNFRHNISPRPRTIKAVNRNSINTCTTQCIINNFHTTTLTSVWISYCFSFINIAPHD